MGRRLRRDALRKRLLTAAWVLALAVLGNVHPLPDGMNADITPPPYVAPSPTAPPPDAVYIAAGSSGTRYHARPDCSSMRSPVALRLEDAVNGGYTPCKLCYPQDKEALP